MSQSIHSIFLNLNLASLQSLSLHNILSISGSFYSLWKESLPYYFHNGIIIASYYVGMIRVAISPKTYRRPTIVERKWKCFEVSVPKISIPKFWDGTNLLQIRALLQSKRGKKVPSCRRQLVPPLILNYF